MISRSMDDSEETCWISQRHKRHSILDI
jgi:hypothetical protein